MEALVKQISEKYGISPEISKGIIQMVVGQIKTKLPSSIASQVDGFLGDSSSPGGDSSAGLGGLKDTFGKLF